jgi:hypothetical protein
MTTVRFKFVGIDIHFIRTKNLFEITFNLEVFFMKIGVILEGDTT